MWLESEVGVGSTFHFTARFDPGSRPIRARPDRVVDLPAVPVLVVDDNATNRRILEEALVNWKMQPTLVASGAEALKALERRIGAASRSRSRSSTVRCRKWTASASPNS